LHNLLTQDKQLMY